MRRCVTVLAITAAALTGYAGTASADADAAVQLPVEQQLLRVENNPQGASVGSPSIASGNVVQAPVHIPVNVCGNTINVIGLLNPTFGNYCVNK